MPFGLVFEMPAGQIAAPWNPLETGQSVRQQHPSFKRQVVRVWLYKTASLMYRPGGIDPSSDSSTEAQTKARREKGPQQTTINRTQNRIQYNSMLNNRVVQ
jgi:hypothetical protein